MKLEGEKRKRSQGLQTFLKETQQNSVFPNGGWNEFSFGIHSLVLQLAKQSCSFFK